MSNQPNNNLPSVGNLSYFIDRMRDTPHLILPALFAWIRGWWYRIKFKAQMKDFSVGKYFRVYGPLYISGPGRIEFGNNCLIISNAIKPVCIRTLSPHAVVKLHDNTGLNGTSIQCMEWVEIGCLSNIADTYITDTNAHSLGKYRRLESVDEVHVKPVKIGENVWVSVQVVILAGVAIGDNSVIGACSLVKSDVPSNVFAAGNPLTIIKNMED